MVAVAHDVVVLFLLLTIGACHTFVGHCLPVGSDSAIDIVLGSLVAP